MEHKCCIVINRWRIIGNQDRHQWNARRRQISPIYFTSEEEQNLSKDEESPNKFFYFTPKDMPSIFVTSVSRYGPMEALVVSSTSNTILLTK